MFVIMVFEILVFDRLHINPNHEIFHCDDMEFTGPLKRRQTFVYYRIFIYSRDLAGTLPMFDDLLDLRVCHFAYSTDGK